VLRILGRFGENLLSGNRINCQNNCRGSPGCAPFRLFNPQLQNKEKGQAASKSQGGKEPLHQSFFQQIGVVVLVNFQKMIYFGSRLAQAFQS
jgi:hypothetical protein